jgi:Flp pilus assembly pilin Flp
VLVAMLLGISTPQIKAFVFMKRSPANHCPPRRAQERKQDMSTIKRFIKDEQGLETVEYAIIAGLIVVGVVTAITAIGIWVRTQFVDLQTDLGA